MFARRGKAVCSIVSVLDDSSVVPAGLARRLKCVHTAITK